VKDVLVESMRHASSHCEAIGAKWEAEQLRSGAAEIERLHGNLSAIIKAAENLNAAMTPHKGELLGTYDSNDWDWAWDQLAEVLDKVTVDGIGDQDPAKAGRIAWRPIQSAPRDGTPVRVFDPTHRYMRHVVIPAYWTGMYWHRMDYTGACGKRVNPTHWMPLRGPDAK
jgi:hypothetical protein